LHDHRRRDREGYRTPSELARLRAWFDAFDTGHFDATIEQDIGSGKLDRLAEEAVADHHAKRSREI
jgi:hypothetical protein